MKHIKRYKLFEDIEQDDVIQKGHKYSWNEIKEILYELTDLGFKIDPDYTKRDFIDSEGEKVYVKDAEYLCTEVTLTKAYTNPDDVSSRNVTKGRKEATWQYFIKWDDSIEQMWVAIQSISSQFEDCYHSVSQTSSGWQVRFIIYTPVEEEVRKEEKERELNNKAHDKVVSTIERARVTILDQFTVQTYYKLKKNKLGETMHYYQGSYEEGFLIMAVNLSELRTQKRAVVTKLEANIDRLERATGRTGGVELREITEEDLKKLHSIGEVSDRFDLPYFTERYLGMLAYIITFDYDKLFKREKDELLGNE